MADDADDTLDERLESIMRRAENFRELLRDGDEVTIGLLDGEVHVEESYRSKFERQHPKLFGRMLAMEAQMHTGWFPYFLALVLVSVFIFGLPLRWWDGIFGEAVCEHAQNWAFYILAPLALLYLAYLICGRWQKVIYRRNRQVLADLIAADRLDRDVLLVMLRDDGELDHVLHQLKLDTGPFPQI